MNRKQIATITLDVFIIICMLLCLYLLYYFDINTGTKRLITTAVVILPVVILAVYEAVCWNKPKKLLKKRIPTLSTLVLLGEDDRPIQIWNLTGKTGLLIGKSSPEYQVDVDLASTEFHTYIDPEHAILNYNSSGWWLSDTSSSNGVSILRKGHELLPGHHAPARLEQGDVICIAKFTRIAVN